MSVYVRGMQMPDRCSHCPLRYVDHSGTAVCKAANAIVILPKDRTRPEYCPLVEVTPPVRLIDIMEPMQVNITLCDSRASVDLIAPTVILDEEDNVHPAVSEEGRRRE